jgi:hypothetical protein
LALLHSDGHFGPGVLQIWDIRVSQFEILVTMLRIAKRIPLLEQEGWLRIKKKLRSHL